MAHHILYIPGFGDNYQNQIKIIKKWHKKDVIVDFLPLNWSDDEPFESKLTRVIKKVDDLVAEHGTISLVGVSAGGSMAMNAYAERKDKISGLVFVCAKLRNPEAVREFWFKRNPAFRKSIFLCQQNVNKLTSIDKTKILTLRSLLDGIIPAADSQIPGAKNRLIPFMVHVPTIGVAITIFKSRIINFLKAKAA